jgi:anaerobic ribonucleoside-triphosphate reductase activating protein
VTEPVMPRGTLLRISRAHYPVTVLGYGTRLGIWVQGCPLACKGCIAKDTWAPEAGTTVEISKLGQLFTEAVAEGADGVTISGGEPLAQPAGLAGLLAEFANIRAALTHRGRSTVQQSRRELDILVYTGYEPAEFTAEQRLAVEPADVLITGRFDVSRPTKLIWRGSANQQMLLRTPLARRRYAVMQDHAPEKAPMQFSIEGADVWLIGVPRVGELGALERDLRDLGARPNSVSWRDQANRPVPGEPG